MPGGFLGFHLFKRKGGDPAKRCILCGAETKRSSFDFCEKCFAMPMEEIEERYLKKRGSLTDERGQA